MKWLFDRLLSLFTTDETATVGYCPSCGEEIQRRDRATIRAQYISPGPTNLTKGYRCPNTIGGRNDTPRRPPGCTPLTKDRSDWLPNQLDAEPSR